jgi:hypothetical protein
MATWRDRLEDGPVGVHRSLRLGWPNWTVRTVSILVILMVSGVGIVVAITLFTHSAPTFTPTAVVTSSCGSSPAPNLAVQDTGSTWVRFNCGANPALVASAGTATATVAGLVTAGYTALYIVQGTPSPTGGCASATASKLLPDATATVVTFGGTGNPPIGAWTYCAEFATLTAKTSFTVAWAQ